MEGIHRNLLSSVRRRKYDVINFIIRTPGPPVCQSYQSFEQLPRRLNFEGLEFGEIKSVIGRSVK